MCRLHSSFMDVDMASFTVRRNDCQRSIGYLRRRRTRDQNDADQGYVYRVEHDVWDGH